MSDRATGAPFDLSARALPLTLFLLLFPTASLVVRGGASALSLAAAFVCIVLLVKDAMGERGRFGWDSTDTALTLALASPVVAILFIELCHGKVIGNTLDSPVRFLAAVPLFLVLRRRPIATLSGIDLSFTIGAFAGLVDLFVSPHEGVRGRNSFLDAIHFGDIALVLGVLAVLSMGWWRKDALVLRVLKVAALGAGLATSVISGSRGGWIAIPAVAVVVALTRAHHAKHPWKLVVTLAVAAVLVGAGLSNSIVQERFQAVVSDYTQYKAGVKDTSVGIRLQLYEVAGNMIAEHPWLGLGAHGFHDSMPAAQKAGLLTPMAADLGMGETHNQMLAYLTDYGVLGGLALLAIYLVPCYVFIRRLRTGNATVRRAAVMGTSFVVSFAIFGLTVEMFDLKITVAFYATVTAVLLAIAAHKDVAH